MARTFLNYPHRPQAKDAQDHLDEGVINNVGSGLNNAMRQGMTVFEAHGDSIGLQKPKPFFGVEGGHIFTSNTLYYPSGDLVPDLENYEINGVFRFLPAKPTFLVPVVYDQYIEISITHHSNNYGQQAGKAVLLTLIRSATDYVQTFGSLPSTPYIEIQEDGFFEVNYVGTRTGEPANKLNIGSVILKMGAPQWSPGDPINAGSPETWPLTGQDVDAWGIFSLRIGQYV